MLFLMPEFIATHDSDVVPEETKEDLDKSIGQMVSLFGSERQKKAIITRKRNRVGNEQQTGAMEPAFSHAQAQVEEMAESFSQFFSLK